MLYTIGESQLSFEGGGSLLCMNQKAKDEEVAQKRTREEGLEDPTSGGIFLHQKKSRKGAYSSEIV